VPTVTHTITYEHPPSDDKLSQLARILKKDSNELIEGVATREVRFSERELYLDVMPHAREKPEATVKNGSQTEVAGIPIPIPFQTHFCVYLPKFIFIRPLSAVPRPIPI
jgi:hypothetical protein